MDLLANVFVAVGLATDAFAVSVSSGMSIKHMKMNKALKVALFFGGFQALMPILGWLLGLSICDFLAAIDHWVAFGLLSFLGIRMIREAQAEEEETLKVNPLDNNVLLGLAIATSLDALAVGLSFAVLKTSIFQPAALIGIITFGLTFLGVFIGNKFGEIFDNKIELIGGLVLVGIGVKILIDHLFFSANLA